MNIVKKYSQELHSFAAPVHIQLAVDEDSFKVKCYSFVFKYCCTQWL